MGDREARVRRCDRDGDVINLAVFAASRAGWSDATISGIDGTGAAGRGVPASTEGQLARGVTREAAVTDSRRSPRDRLTASPIRDSTNALETRRKRLTRSVPIRFRQSSVLHAEEIFGREHMARFRREPRGTSPGAHHRSHLDRGESRHEIRASADASERLE
jgi:hypothetical protein